MMAFRLTYTPRFQKHFASLTAQEKKQVSRKLSLFAENPLHPSLRVKRIQGADVLFEFSVNMDIRVIWCREGDVLILLLDIGHHDILKQF